MTDKQSFPSVRSLFRDSWSTTKGIAARFFLWYLVGSVSTLAIVLSLAIVAGVAVFVTSLLPVVVPPVAQIAAVVLLALAFLSLLVVVTVTFITVGYKILAEYPKKRSFDELVRASWKKSGTFVALFVFSIPFWGSLFAFFIPAIVISFFMSFAVLGVMIKDRPAWSAMKRSVALWQSQPGQLFLKGVVVTVCLYLLSFLPYGLQQLIQLIQHQSLALSLQTLVALASIFYSFLLSVFTLVYSIKVFEAAEELTPESVKPSMWWLWLVSLLGWIVVIALVVGSIVYVTSTTGREFRARIEQQAQQELGLKLNQATQLDQEAADKLAEDSFVEINVRRVNAGNKPLALDPQLCVYSKKLLAVQDAEGNESKAIGEMLDRDINDPALHKQYFQGYFMVTYALKFGARSFDTAASVVDVWAGDDQPLFPALVSDPEFKAACVVANPHYVLVVPVK